MPVCDVAEGGKKGRDGGGLGWSGLLNLASEVEVMLAFFGPLKIGGDYE